MLDEPLSGICGQVRTGFNQIPNTAPEGHVLAAMGHQWDTFRTNGHFSRGKGRVFKSPILHLTLMQVIAGSRRPRNPRGFSVRQGWLLGGFVNHCEGLLHGILHRFGRGVKMTVRDLQVVLSCLPEGNRE